MGDPDHDQSGLFGGLDDEHSVDTPSIFQGNPDPKDTASPSNPASAGGLLPASVLGAAPSSESDAVDSASLAWDIPDTTQYTSFIDSLGSYDSSTLLPQTWAFSPQLTGLQLRQQLSLSQQTKPGPQPTAVTDISPLSLYAQPMNNPLSTSTAGEPHVRPTFPPEVLNTLTPAQQEKLRSIAMPAHLQYHSPKSEPSPDSAAGESNKGGVSSPDAPEPFKATSRKRKSSAEVEEDEDEDDGDFDSHQPVKKTAHNMIEKRYRTNLNDKIAALRDSVPSLRIMSKSARGEDTTEDREELHGLTPAHKLNKATVLSKATEYIRHLEKRNTRLLDENSAMQQRIAAFEKLFMAGAMNGAISPIPQPPTPLQYAQDTSAFLTTPMATPRGPDPPGMIPVPDDMKRILSQQMAVGRPYPVPQPPFQQSPALVRQQQIQQQQQQQQQQQMQTGRWNNAGPYFGKLMVGSLAGLMILEAVRENEQSNEKPDGRGLFAAPVQLLASLASSSHFSVAGYHLSTTETIHTLKLLALLGLLLWAFIPSLFAPKSPKSHKTLAAQTSLEAVPSLASPIHVRRQAWLTAIQTVWVPRHNFFLEAAALILKTMKLSLRNTIGVEGYQMLTGLTEEQETARVKAWTIALDAQLAGGDVEINKSRLTLTLLASGTLPDSPQRLMLKALHTRVLLWQPGQRGLLSCLVRIFATEIARWKWTEAKQLNRMMTQLRKASDVASDEELPDHLALLLQQDCDGVLTDDIVQRAYNLAWNHPTTQGVVKAAEGMNAVVDDPAVRSPMDAVASWYSSVVLQQVLRSTLADGKDSNGKAASAAERLNLAIKVAPIGSNAQVRALVARAVLTEEKRGACIAAALQCIGPPLRPDNHAQSSKDVPPLIGSPISSSAPDPDAQMALRCAMAIAQLQRFSAPPREALILIESISPHPDIGGASLLGCTAAFRLMDLLYTHPAAAESCSRPLEKLAGSLRIWVGGAVGEKWGLDEDVRRLMIDRCLDITKSIVGMSSDPGYGSMSDCEEEGTC